MARQPNRGRAAPVTPATASAEAVDDEIQTEGDAPATPAAPVVPAEPAEPAIPPEGGDGAAVPAEGGEAPTARVARPALSGDQVSRLHMLGERLGATGEQIRAAIAAAGGSYDMALEGISAHLAEGDDMTQPMHGRPTAQVLRDERTTRREGMTDALAAQFGRTDPSDRGRAYMGMSLVEMAAAASGYEGPLRSAGDRTRAFEMAGHSTSDFPSIFENAVNRTLLAQYEAAEPTYQEVALRSDFRDFRPHGHLGIGDFPTLLPVLENGEIKFGSVGESKETAVLTPYARGLAFSRQVMVNDDVGAISRLIESYGIAIADFEEQTAWAFFLSAKLSDGNAVFRPGLNNKAAAGTAITPEALDAGRAAIRSQKRLDGDRKLSSNFAPTILVCGPAKEGEALRALFPTVPTEVGQANIWAGKLKLVVTNEITDNSWYLFADPRRPGAEVFTYGYLDGATAPRMRTEEPFGRQGFAMTVEHDFGLGAVGYRGGWFNAGA